jgi:hypothetical protein
MGKAEKVWLHSALTDMDTDTLELLMYHIAVECQRRGIPGAEHLMLRVSAIHCARNPTAKRRLPKRS